MDAKPHLLLKTKTRQFPSDILFLDTETKFKLVAHKIKIHQLRMGICRHYTLANGQTLEKSDEIAIRTKADFINWLDKKLKPRSRFYIVAHNIVYDATILDLFRQLPKIGFTMQSLYSKGQTCIIRFKRGQSSLILLDNGNIFSGALERWGRIFNIPKLEIDFFNCAYDELVTYCSRDVEIMVKSWQAWIDFNIRNDCGGFRETVGSTAFNAWRSSYTGKPVYVHKDTNVLKLERDAYHGGRVEAFYQGRLDGGAFYYLDINNMYGHVMKKESYPLALMGYSNRLGLNRMITYLNRYMVIARVTVNVDEPAYVTKHNGFTCYPLGRFETCLTTHELIYALKNGWIESVQEFAWYKKSNLFAEFVDKFYNLRMDYKLQGNKGFEQICKLMINSLYGKFGQTGIEQRIIGRVEHDTIWHMPVVNIDTGARSFQNAIGGIVYEETHLGESYHAVPSIAAHVTANARLYLLSLIKQAGWMNVFYCDTDSLIVNDSGYHALKHMLNDDALGMLKIETQSDYLIVNAPKDYEMRDRKKIKGIRNNALELSSGVFEQEQWIKLAGLIREGFTNGYTSHEIIKHQLRKITSGVVSEGGKIEPFRLGLPR